MTGIENLRAELVAGEVRLIPFADCHLEPLRAVCNEDTEIWEIYPYSMLGEHFDRRIERQALLTDWVIFAVMDASGVVGTTSYIPRDAASGVVEIGATYIAPRVRSSTLNRAMKKLMIEHAFAQGYHRIEFRVDERNKRSQAAVLKLGAIREGTLRGDRVTWTGHRRSTCVFSLLHGEWFG